MTDLVGGPLPVLAYYVTVAVSVPVAVISFTLARRRLLEPILVATIGAVGLLSLLAIGTLAALNSPAAGLTALKVALGAGVGFVVVPLLLGTFVVRRASGVDRDRALRRAVAGWPVALLVSLGVFVWTGGLHSDLTVFADAESVVDLVAWAATILVGPGLFGVLHQRLRP